MTSIARNRLIGDELRKRRKETGLNLTELGNRVGVGKSTIARWETGERTISRDELVRVLGALGIVGEASRDLLAAHAGMDQPAWYDADDVPRRMRQLAALEARATRITDIAIVTIPGLLQTREFAAAALRGTGITGADELERRADARLARQRILPSVEYRAVLDEACLLRPFGDRRVMASQCERLVNLADADGIEIQVMPMERGAHPALIGAYMLLEFARGLPVVHVEGLRSSTLLDGRAEARDYVAATDTVRGLAMSPEASRGLIAEYARKWRHA